MASYTITPSFGFSTSRSTSRAIGHRAEGREFTLNYLGFYDHEALLTLMDDFCTAHGVEGDFRSALADFFAGFEKKYKLPQHTSAWASLHLEKPGTPHAVGQSDVSVGGPGEVPHLSAKVSTMFIGQGTLLWEAEPPACSTDTAIQSFRSVGWEMIARGEAAGTDADGENIRHWADNELKKLELPVVSPQIKQAVSWITGSKGNSGKRSEPDFSHLPKGRIWWVTQTRWPTAGPVFELTSLQQCTATLFSLAPRRRCGGMEMHRVNGMSRRRR